MSIFRVRPDGDRLVLESRFTEAAEKRLREQNPGKPLPKQPPVTLAVIGRDVLLAQDGPTRGLRVSIYRDADGDVKGINLGGRIALKSR